MDEVRLHALDHLLEHKKKKRSKGHITSVFDQNISKKNDIVWKAILLIGHNNSKYEKWSPNYKGLYVIVKVLKRGVYHLSNQDEELHYRSIND